MSTSIPSTMRAIQIKEYGGPEKLEMAQVDVPKPKDDEVLVKVEWSGVNYIDNYMRQGIYKSHLPLLLGKEPSGVVVSAGSKSDLKQGQRVAGLAPDGAYAEYATIPDRLTAPIPEGVSTKTAAVALLQGLTAITMVREAHHVEKGQWILVHAAAGGVGSLLVQICKALGANVIGTVSTQEKADIVKSYGADHAIIYSADKMEDMVKQILDITGGEGVHASLDGVGKMTWDSNFVVLRRKGTLVTFGNASGPVEPFAPLRLSAKNLKVVRPTLFNYVATKEEMRQYSAELFELISSGKLKTPVWKEEGYPFSAEGLRQTVEDITSRKTTGKLVVKVAE